MKASLLALSHPLPFRISINLFNLHQSPQSPLVSPVFGIDYPPIKQLSWRIGNTGQESIRAISPSTYKPSKYLVLTSGCRSTIDTVNLQGAISEIHAQQESCSPSHCRSAGCSWPPSGWYFTSPKALWALILSLFSSAQVSEGSQELFIPVSYSSPSFFPGSPLARRGFSWSRS